MMIVMFDRWATTPYLLYKGRRKVEKDPMSFKNQRALTLVVKGGLDFQLLRSVRSTGPVLLKLIAEGAVERPYDDLFERIPHVRKSKCGVNNRSRHTPLTSIVLASSVPDKAADLSNTYP